MSEQPTVKLKALPVLEVTPKDVAEINVDDSVTFLINGGAIYYMVTDKDLAKDREETFSMTERLFNVIRTYLRRKFGQLEPSQETHVLNAVRTNLYNPLKAMEQRYPNFVQACVEVKITTDDDDIRVHYTLRDKEGKSLRHN